MLRNQLYLQYHDKEYNRKIDETRKGQNGNREGKNEYNISTVKRERAKRI